MNYPMFPLDWFDGLLLSVKLFDTQEWLVCSNRTHGDDPYDFDLLSSVVKNWNLENAMRRI